MNSIVIISLWILLLLNEVLCQGKYPRSIRILSTNFHTNDKLPTTRTAFAFMKKQPSPERQKKLARHPMRLCIFNAQSSRGNFKQATPRACHHHRVPAQWSQSGIHLDYNKIFQKNNDDFTKKAIFHQFWTIESNSKTTVHFWLLDWMVARSSGDGNICVLIARTACIPTPSAARVFRMTTRWQACVPCDMCVGSVGSYCVCLSLCWGCGLMTGTCEHVSVFIYFLLVGARAALVKGPYVISTFLFVSRDESGWLFSGWGRVGKICSLCSGNLVKWKQIIENI